MRVISAWPHLFHSVAWSPRGDVVAVGRSGGGIALLDPSTGRTLREWKAHTGNVRVLEWSPDGQRLASADDLESSVRLWNAGTGASTGTFLSTVSKPRRLAWSPDGSRISVGVGIPLSSSQWWVELHDVSLARRDALLTEVAGFAWSPDGKRYVVGGTREVRVYATATHQLQATWSGSWGTAWVLDWSPDGRWLGVGDMAGSLAVLEADTGAVVGQARQEDPSGLGARRYHALRFHPSRPALAAVQALPAAVDVLTVDAVTRGLLLRELLPHDYEVDAVAWNPSGDRLASGGREGLIRLWDRQGSPVRTLAGHGGKAIRALAWDGGGTRLASGGVDGQACVWRVEDGTLVRAPIQLATGQEPLPIEVRGVALSPDGRRLATLSGFNPASSTTSTVRVWDVDSGGEVFRFPERNRAVRALTWTPDGRYVVAVGSDSRWELWDSQTGELRIVESGVDAQPLTAALSPDGTRLAIGHRPGLSVHELLTGKVLEETRGGLDPYTLTWSPDGRLIAGGGVGGLVFTWAVNAGLALAVVGFHDGDVNAVSWRADGQSLTTGGSDAALSTWRLTP
nr:WD40 repeat domain-containing protein [Myxococcus sp. RHSTA-1-4]